MVPHTQSNSNKKNTYLVLSHSEVSSFSPSAVENVTNQYHTSCILQFPPTRSPYQSMWNDLRRYKHELDRATAVFSMRHSNHGARTAGPWSDLLCYDKLNIIIIITSLVNTKGEKSAS